MSAVDDHLATLPGDQRDALAHVREIALRAAPGAEEGTSYGMPALRWEGKPLLGLQATAKHLALYPFSPEVIDAVRGRLDGYSLSKGTVRFSPEQPLPDDVVEDMVRLRMQEIA